MANTFQLSVVAPDRTVVETVVISVIAPGTEGYLGVNAGHVPLITSLKTGLLEYRDEDSQLHLVAVRGGFMEITATSVIVLADAAMPAQEINIKDAEARLEQARKALRGEDSSMDSTTALEQIDLAMNQIKAARRKQS